MEPGPGGLGESVAAARATDFVPSCVFNQSALFFIRASKTDTGSDPMIWNLYETVPSPFETEMGLTTMDPGGASGKMVCSKAAKLAPDWGALEAGYTATKDIDGAAVVDGGSVVVTCDVVVGDSVVVVGGNVVVVVVGGTVVVVVMGGGCVLVMGSIEVVVVGCSVVVVGLNVVVDNVVLGGGTAVVFGAAVDVFGASVVLAGVAVVFGA